MSFKIASTKNEESSVFVKENKKKKVQIAKKKQPKIIKVKSADQDYLLKKKGLGYVTLSKLQEIKFDYTKEKYIKPNLKPPMSIQFIGHVDAGKSTLCGHLARLLSPQTTQEVQKLAYIFDSFPEEQQLGQTQEPVYECFELSDRKIIVIDNPGHKGFVPRVLQYSQAADVVCLIVSTKLNEFESGFEKEGQTREHMVGAVGVQSGKSGIVVVANKMDANNWNQQIFNDISHKITEWIDKEIKSTAIIVCPVSALNGTNLMNKNNVPEWYSKNGETLVQILEKMPMPVRQTDSFLRIPIVDVLKDQGVFVFGKVESGIVVINQELLVMPYKTQLKIVRIYNSQYQSVPYALPGEYVKLKVKNVTENELKQGFIICNIEDFCHVTYEIEAEIKITDLPEHKPILSGGYKCILHIHTIIEEVEIKEVLGYKNSENNFVPQSFLRPGMTGKARIISQQYLCVEKYETNQYLGSFALRDESKTIGFGKILRLKPATKLPTLQVKQPEITEKKEEGKKEEEKKLQSINEEDEDN